MPTRLGLIAGAGRFPFLVADGARRAGCEVVIVGLRGFASPALARHADRFYWSGLVKLGRWLRIFRREGVTQAILAGSVKKSEMYGRLRLLRTLPDWTSIRLWFFDVPDRRNDTLLRATADVMARRGVILQDSTRYCRDALSREGCLTATKPSEAQQRDLVFGWRMAKELGRLDIGQSVAIKEQEVVAVEAIEGTDAMIRRAGQLCAHGGWTLVKVAKPNQDMRFDVPTVGPDTIETLAANGAKMLVVEAGKTLVIEPEKLEALAERHRIVVIAHGG